jgi:hypothetical protein
VYLSGVAKLMNPSIYAKIQNSIVVNMQLLSSTDFMDPAFTWVLIINPYCEDGITATGVGCSYDGKGFIAAPGSNQPPPPPVPSQPVQVSLQIVEADLQPVFSDIINSIVNGDSTFVQKYVVVQVQSAQSTSTPIT